MDTDNQPIDTSQLGMRKPNAKNDHDGSVATSFAEHPSKRDQQPFQFNNSPAKRAKLSSSVNPLFFKKTPQIVGAGGGDETGLFHNAQLVDTSKKSLRRNYLEDGDKGNSFSGSMRLTGEANAVTEAITEKLTISNRREGPGNQDSSSIVDRGRRLSKTPPPFSIEFEDSNESPLPPAIKQRHASPDTIKRGLEEIYSSGKRKAHHERIDFGSTPDWSPTRKQFFDEVRDPIDHYYPAASMGTKDKGYRMFLERREALQQEIRLLEDELVVEKRREAVGKGLKETVATPDEVSSFITQCLALNDEEVARNVAIIKGARELEIDLRHKSPLENGPLQHGMKDLSALTFTDYNTSARVPNSDSLCRRFLQGYSHESLLHFKATIDVIPNSGPIVNSLGVEYSDWARTELGPTLSKLSAARNISIALYSISSYADLAKRRAECWIILQSRFYKFIPVATQSDLIIKPPRLPEGGSKIGRRLIVANLPRRKMTFRGRNALSNTQNSSEAEVCLSWHIDIKPTGESYSDVSASIKLLPDAADEILFTQQMSNLFKALVGEYGFKEGASRLLGTLFGIEWLS
ncbi:hypothetical protein TWF481_011755 [Arthrobotrys musiformis]|uniref:Uncharacterized protein n=1 Tax=Arthrobotrys musiformis TaxID=47236 RepID=A0AAV9VW40_9PEZI